MSNSPNTLEGTVQWFDPKGYGRIKAEDGQSYFVHYLQIRVSGFRLLREGQIVTFTPSANDRGPLALDVVPMT